MPDLDKRVIILEQNYKSLEGTFKDMRTWLEGRLSHTDEALKALADKISDSQKAPWQLLLSAMAVTITMISLAAAVVYSDIHRNEDEINSRPTRTEFNLLRETMSLEIELLGSKIDIGR